MIDKDAQKIRVEFAHHFPADSSQDFEYSASLLPGNTFVSHCLGGDSKTAHIVEYTGMIQIEGRMYAEFWGTHVTMPDELLPCKMPQLIEQSLPLDLILGIDFGMTEPPVVISIPHGISDPLSGITPVPQKVTVVIGINNTVIFSNDDDTPRTINSDHGEFTTPHLRPNQTHTIVFAEPGIFDYHGKPGPWITGTITVVEQNED